VPIFIALTSVAELTQRHDEEQFIVRLHFGEVADVVNLVPAPNAQRNADFGRGLLRRLALQTLADRMILLRITYTAARPWET
jgi:hypothetical protein